MIEKIIEIVGRSYGVTPDQLTGDSRKGLLPEARRMVAVFIIRNGFDNKEAIIAVNRTRIWVYRAVKTIDYEMTIYKNVTHRYNQINTVIEEYKSNNI